MDMDASHGDEAGEVPAERGEPMMPTNGSTVAATSRETSVSADERGAWVVGLDGSECAVNALQWAAANVADRGAALSLVSAWQTPVVGAYPMSTPVTVPFDETELHDAAAHEVADIATELRERVAVPVTAAVGRGGPAQVLLEASESAAALVIGSRGRGGFAPAAARLHEHAVCNPRVGSDDRGPW